MDKQKTHKLISVCLEIIVTLALTVGLWYVGTFGSENDAPKFAVVFYSCIGLFATMVLTNVISYSCIKHKMQTAKLRELHRRAEKWKTDIERNYVAARHAVERSIVVGYLAFILVIVLLCCVQISFGGTNLPFKRFAPLIIIEMCIVFALIFISCYLLQRRRGKPHGNDRFLLWQTECPLIYETIRNAAEACGCDLPITADIDSDNVSVSVHRNHITIGINYLHATLLTRAELYNVMLHEFAHVCNSDVKRNERYSCIQAKFDESGLSRPAKFFRTVLFGVPLYYAMFKMDVYTIVANRHHEIEADKTVAKLGDPQSYVNALAKSRAIAEFMSAPKPELDYYYYEPESPAHKYASVKYSLYAKYIAQFASRISERIAKELPAHIDSHPTFAARLAAMGCTTFDVCAVEPDAIYAEEQQNLIKRADTMLADKYNAVYSDYRSKHYLPRKQAIEEYERDSASKPPDERQLLKGLKLYYGIDNDKALEIANTILARLPLAPKANFIKGLILALHYDDDCIDCFKKAARSALLAETALEKIGVYYLQTSNVARLAVYRDSIAAYAQSMYDASSKAAFLRSTKTAAHDVDEVTCARLVDGITGIAPNTKSIYLCKYTDPCGNAHYPVLCKIKRSPKQSCREYRDTVLEVNDYVEMFSDEYDFNVCPKRVKQVRAIKATIGALIYSKQ